MPNIIISSDNVLRLVGLRRDQDFAFQTSATVEATLYTKAPEENPVTADEVQDGNSWPAAMAYRDPLTRGFGGDATTPSTIKSTSGFNATMTVGATNALSLFAGDFVWVFHQEEYIWRVRSAASVAADGSGAVHLQPFLWPAGEAEPTSFNGVKGERMEIADGTYEVTLTDALTLTNKDKYWAKIKAVSGGSTHHLWVQLKALFETRK